LAISEAYNLGFKESKGDILCCMHNDTIVPFGWNYLMDKVARRGDIAFPMVDESTGFCELRGIKKTESWQTPSACFVLSRESWDQLGGYDEQFKEMHGEDIDLFRRAELLGKNLVRCDVTVLHYRGATRSLTKDGGAKAFQDNWNKFYFKHANKSGEELFLPRISEKPQEVIKNGTYS